MPTFTMEGHDEGDHYMRTGIFDAELYANDRHVKDPIWKEPEVMMSEAAIGTRGIESTVSNRRRGVGYGTGHLILRKEHIGPEIYHG